jgi:hypothetical protein
MNLNFTEKIQVSNGIVYGIMNKMGSINKQWKERYFILIKSDKIIKYYKKENLKQEISSIPIVYAYIPVIINYY